MRLIFVLGIYSHYETACIIVLADKVLIKKLENMRVRLRELESVSSDKMGGAVSLKTIPLHLGWHGSPGYNRCTGSYRVLN